MILIFIAIIITRKDKNKDRNQKIGKSSLNKICKVVIRIKLNKKTMK
jgi:hypothetical protein